MVTGNGYRWIARTIYLRSTMAIDTSRNLWWPAMAIDGHSAQSIALDNQCLSIGSVGMSMIATHTMCTTINNNIKKQSNTIYAVRQLFNTRYQVYFIVLHVVPEVPVCDNIHQGTRYQVAAMHVLCRDRQ